MATPARRTIRVDLVAFAVVAVGVVALLVLLSVQTQRVHQVASSITYPQLTQPAQTAAVQSVAFIGDSYSAGTGSSGYDSRFTTLVAAYEGWSSRSFANGGTGYLRGTTADARAGCGEDFCPDYKQVIGAVKAYDPTIVFVSGGRNDVGLKQSSVVKAVDGFFEELRTALPHARIIVTSPVWAYSTPPAQLAQIQGAVRDAVTRVGGTYLDIKEPLVSDRSLVAKDRVHPNDRGHAKLAKVVEVALSGAEPTPTPTPTPTQH